MILLNPKQHQRPYADARSTEVMRATIEFFETKGKDKLLADYYERGWYADFLEFVRQNRIFATMCTPAGEGAAVFRAVGEWHVVENRWKQAADRFAVLCRVDQLDGWDVSTLDSLRQGPVLIEGADLAGYERFRDETIARYTTATAQVGDRVLKVSLLRPTNEHVLAALHPYADATAKAFASADESGDVFMAAWRSVSLALWEYRSGNYLKAVQWAQRCLAYPETNAPRTATARIILALSYQQLGRGREAHAALAEGREIIEAKSKTHLERGTPVQGFWFDWLFARILLREARVLAEKSSE